MRRDPTPSRVGPGRRRLFRQARRRVPWGLAMMAGLLGGGAFALAGCRASGSDAGEHRARYRQGPGEGRTLIYAASNHIRALDDQGRELAVIRLGRLVTELRFSADGRLAFAGTSDGTWVIDAIAHRARARLGEGPVRGLREVGSRLEVITGGPASRLERFDPISGRRLGRERIEGGVDAFAAAGADGSPQDAASYVYQAGERRLIARGGAGQLLWQRALGELTSRDPALGSAWPSPYLAVAPDQKTVFVPVSGANAGLICVEARSGAAILRRFDLAASLRHIVVLPDGRTLAINALDRLLVYDLATGRRDLVPMTHVFSGLAVDPDGQRLYAAVPIYGDTEGGAIAVVDLPRRRLLRLLSTPQMSPFTVAVRPAKVPAERR